MYIASKNERGAIELLQDPLIRLVMDSDGVTEQAMIAILENLRIALAARKIDGAYGKGGRAERGRGQEGVPRLWRAEPRPTGPSDAGRLPALVRGRC